MRLGDKLFHLRVKKQVTQASVAEATGITQATISRLENDLIGQPEFFTLCKLSRYYEVDINHFIPWREEDEST
jgi:transcriptional regulator with XRE-family HTH domain